MHRTDRAVPWSSARAALVAVIVILSASVLFGCGAGGATGAFGSAGATASGAGPASAPGSEGSGASSPAAASGGESGPAGSAEAASPEGGPASPGGSEPVASAAPEGSPSASESATAGGASAQPSTPATPESDGASDRAYLVQVMTRIARPVLEATSQGQLHEVLPIHDWEQERADWTHYEAFARTLAGIAPWLELGPDETPEGQLRAEFITLAQQSLINATDPDSPDYMNFGQVPDQPLVETAYLAAALLTAPTQLWEPLDDDQRANVLDALRMSREIPQTHDNNWHLFPAMAEAALWRYGDDVEMEPIQLAVDLFEIEWYLGDGVYGDGDEFQWDYYNSYVIHPMLLEVESVSQEMGEPVGDLELALERGRRYAQILERQISPEGTFPVMGRSSAYRFAAFYHLAYMALNHQLPETMDQGAARAGITAVVRNQVEAPGTFDEQGWLQLGAVGNQPGLTETYNATGSLYVCLTGLVHLGLPADDPFWTAPAASWTQKRIWTGEDVPRDQGLESAD